MSIQFEYYSSRESEQFTFYRIPKALFTDPAFFGLSTDAKVLYGLMLDRISLSVRSGWVDEQDHVYIYYTQGEIMDELYRKLRAKGSCITVSALNPGFMGETNLAGGNMTKERVEQVKQTMPDRFGELSVSAQAAADILTDDRYLSAEAVYYDRSTNAAKSSPLSYSEEYARELWDASVNLSALR